MQKVDKQYRKYKPVRTPKKSICWYGTHKLPKNLNINLHNYQTETAIFLVTKHEKTITACSYLSFSIQKIHQNSKKWWLLWGIALWKWLWGCFSQFLLWYGANASEAVQKISTRILLSYVNSLKQLIFKLYLWKNIFSSLLPAYWRYKPGFCFFPDI